MRKELAMKSSIIGVLAKLCSTILSFITTRFFVRYLGVELLGINGVFSNVLGFLQLAEMGIGTAITYALYQPIVDGNVKEIQILMGFYKKIYRCICALILVFGVLLTPFLTFFVEDAAYSNSYLVLIYYIQLASSASTYLLAYKRNLLYADQKQYISTFIDICVNACCCIMRILVILYIRSYIIYLLILVLQNIVSNLIISSYCNRQYPYLKEKAQDAYDKMDQLKANVRNLMIGRVGGWVYSSTDHLIISKFVGVTAVGLISNYYTLRTALCSIVGSIVAPIQPMMGNYVRSCKKKEKVFELFLNYSFIRFCIANVVTVGFIVMCNPVVELWLGGQYLLPKYIVVLLAVDMFISVTHGPTGEFVQVLGLFYDDRNMSLLGMAINLVSSLVLVQVLGIGGVLAGTVIAQCYYWFARARIVFRQYFHKGTWKYVFRIIKYVASTVAEVLALEALFSLSILSRCSIFWVIIRCVICVACCVGALALANFRTAEWVYMIDMLKKYVQKLWRKTGGRTYDLGN